MSRAKLVRRAALAALVLVVVGTLIAAVVLVGVVRAAYPQTSGRIEVPGLQGKVDVLRDDQGVPQIYADTARDLFFAQGFVTSQDRFFEMDFRRHVTSGRLSELIGADGLTSDKLVRTLGWRRVAEAELPLLAPSTRQHLQAYADGVNAYLDHAGGPAETSLEYVVLARRFGDRRIERWTPVDSLAWLKGVAWDLRGDYRSELLRARLASTIAPRRLAQLFPPYPTRAHAPILTEQDWAPGRGSQPTVPGAADAAGASARSSVASATSPARASSAGAAHTSSETTDTRPPLTSYAAGPAAQRATPPGYLRADGAQAAYEQAATALGAVPALVGRGEAVGSNAWVVSGRHTTTGKPLLANDPHLGVGLPGVWHQAGLHCRTVGPQCPFDVAGFTYAGLPGIVIGHNARIAWGMTNLRPDVTDFYLEQVLGDKYFRDGEWLGVDTHAETVTVAGGDDVSFAVRRTVHGPLLSDVLEEVRRAGQVSPVEGKNDTGSYEVSLAWTGLVPNRTADAVFALNAATNFEEFRAAAASFAVPSQNLLYADVDGHIGYQAPGLIPIRASSTEGAPPGYWPAPGWKGEYDWRGFVPFEDLPFAYDPADGFLVAANQMVAASPRPFLTSEWDQGYRSQRIRTLLATSLKKGKLSPDAMTQVQQDTYSEFADQLVKLLLKVDLSKDRFTREAQDLLRRWDYTQPVGQSRAAAAAAYFNAAWANLLALTFNDELPDGFEADGGDQWMAALMRLTSTPRDPWWDNRLTPNITEDMTEVLRQSLVNARLDLTRALGKTPGIWQWGRLHTLRLRHPVFGGPDTPGYLQATFNRGPVELPGGTEQVNANGWNAAADSFEVDWAPSMRMVVDLADFDRSRWVNQTGVSGHAYSPHYVDQLDAWAAGTSFAWRFSREAIRVAAAEHLVLQPKQAADR